MTSSTSELRSLRSERLRRLYRTFPDAYAADVLSARLTDDQSGILLDLVAHRRNAVMASHGVGKTHVAAIAANWWYDCWDEHISYITAPTWPQALGLTFKYVVKMRRERNLPGEILESGLVRDPDKILAGAHYIRALNAENGEGFQGEHSAPILIILEEAVGVPGYIWEATDGLMTVPECRLLAICNPTNEATPMGEACRSSLYRVRTINALNHPNIVAELRGDIPPFPKATRLGWVEEMIEKECEPARATDGDAFEFPPGSDSYHLPNAVFQGRVLGQFPSQADTQVIPRGWLTKLPLLEPSGRPEIGCDVARHGRDRTTIAARDGAAVLSVREVRRMDVDAVAGELKQLADELGRVCNVQPKDIPIRVDVTGGLGVAPAVMLANLGYRAIEVNSSSCASEKERYPNKRSELWFNLRERARTKDLCLARLPSADREKLIKELSTPSWKSNSRGQRVVESKDDIKKKMNGQSPDLADALNLAFDGTGGNWEDASPNGDRSGDDEELSRVPTSQPRLW